jgi:hypothetical protein
MPTTRRPAHDFAAAKAAFNTATVTVGGLYLTTLGRGDPDRNDRLNHADLLGHVVVVQPEPNSRRPQTGSNRTSGSAHEGGNPLRTLGRSAAPQPSSRPPEVLVT